MSPKVVMRIEMPGAKKLLSTRRLEWIVSAVVGTSTSLSFANHILDIWARTPAQQILILLGLTVLFGLFAYGLIFRFTRRRLTSFGPRARTVWILLSILIGGVLMLVVLVEPRLPLTRHHLAIVATGDRNAMAQGSEVWVLEIRRPDGSMLSLDDLSLSGEWEVRDTVLLSYKDQPAVAEWSGGSEGGEFALIFVSHPWSGVVQVEWDGNEQRRDLYAPTGTQIPVTLSAAPDAGRTADRMLLAAVAYVADLVTLAMLVLVGSVWLATRGAVCERPVDVPRWSWAYYALPCALTWTIWLLIFWPGLMSPDSVNQWSQMLSGNLNDWHPAFHTLTNWMITRLWLSSAAVALAQIAGLSGVVGCGLARIRRLGTPTPVVWATCALFSLSPVNGTMVITLWKDIPYSICVLALTLLVLEIAASNGAWLEPRPRWMLLGGVAALTALYRHNGPVAGFGTLAVLALVYPHQRRRLAVALLVALGVWLGVRGPLYSGLGVTTNTLPSLMPLIHQVAAHMVARTPLEQEDQAYLNSIRPASVGWPYSCYSIGPTVWDGQFRWDVIEANPGRFTRLWWNLTRRDPRPVLKHLLCSSALVVNVTQPAGSYFSASAVWITEQGGPGTIHPNELDLRPKSLLPRLALPLATMLMRSQRPELSWFVWRPAMYLYIALGGALILSVRSRRWTYLLMIASITLHSATVLVTGIAQNVRFQYPVYLVALLAVGLSFSARSGGGTSGAQGR